jgi:hypothetical protein
MNFRLRFGLPLLIVPATYQSRWFLVPMVDSGHLWFWVLVIGSGHSWVRVPFISPVPVGGTSYRSLFMGSWLPALVDGSTSRS